jgi:nucleoside 2-deoxyribosyltransferase
VLNAGVPLKYEIRYSKFIVCDLSGHRNGVYYEAGYGAALNKEVILTCRDDCFEKMHFDVAQINTIRWSDEEDLKLKLCKRIEATIGKR